MDAKGYHQYKEQSIHSMTPGELLNLLFDELVKRTIRAELALNQENYDLYEESLDRAIDIVHYLDDTLDREFPISHDLHRMYEYFSYELGRAKIGRKKEVLMPVKEMIAEMRDSFREAEKNSTAGE